MRVKRGLTLLKRRKPAPPASRRFVDRKKEKARRECRLWRRAGQGRAGREGRE